MAFAGKRVLSLESRRSVETAELIRRNDGVPVVAPSMREIPLEENEAALRFGERLLAGEFDMVIFLTGVGTRQMMKVLASRYETDSVIEALGRVVRVARGPKPTAALREIGVLPDIVAPEPNTWRELIDSIAAQPAGARIAVQEYGRPSPELVEALRGRGSEVTQVPVYTYGFPEDLQPLRNAVSELAAERIEVTLLTTAQQVVHLMQIARDMDEDEKASAGLRRSVIASIGPTTTEMLAEYGFVPDLQSSRPKLGFLVKEAAEKAEELSWNKKI